MRVGVQAGSGAAAAVEGSDRPAGADAAGRLLGRLSVLPALLATAWLLAGLPLLLLGHFTPVLMLIVSLPLAVVLAGLGLRWIPGRWPGIQGREPDLGGTPWWTVIGVLAVAAAFGVDQMIYHSQFIIVMRDPASYLNFGYWIGHHGSLPIPQDAAAFGGAHHLLRFDGFAYYQVGNTVVPQFMAGLPMVLAAGFWTGGVSAAAAVSPLLGACAVVAFGGLTARLVGSRWAPLAALVLALSLPEQFTSRSDYSEPLTQILILGGICLVIDSLGTDGVRARVLAALGGLALGLTLLVRIDGASDILPLIPYCGLLLIARRRQALPLLGGLVVGGLYGVIDGAVLSRPYLHSIKSSLVPLMLLAGVVAVATAAAVALLWRRGLPQVRGRWLPNAVAALVVLVAAGFAIRPYAQTVRGASAKGYEQSMAGYQKLNHLPVDPTRLYYELSMHWVFWYVGVPAVVLATLAAALLSRASLRGLAATWTLPLLLFAWTIVVTLYKPSITPDQPWASRRLVPAVLPGFVLLAVWGARWVLRWIRGTGIGRVGYSALAACCVAALVLPAVQTTFGLFKYGGPVGVKLAADGLAVKKTYQGEIAAVGGMCAAIPHGSSVVFVNNRDADWLIQVVRGMCGQPVARLDSPNRSAVDTVVRGIVHAGRRPVLLAANPAQLRRYGAGPMRQIMRLRTTIDESSLTTAPRGTWRIALNVWMSEPSP